MTVRVLPSIVRKAIGTFVLLGVVVVGLLVTPLIGPAAMAAPAQNAKALQGVAPKSPCWWDQVAWGVMSPAQQQAWGVLGWDAVRWDSSDPAKAPDSDDEDWADLTPEEQAAAAALGYTEKSWDSFDYSVCDN